MKTNLPIGTLVKVTLRKDAVGYFPKPDNNIYYGLIFDSDDEHLSLKGFGVDTKYNLHFGVFNRFMNDDISVEEVTL